MAEKKKKEEASSGASGGTRALVFLVLALVAGAAATIVIYQVIQNYQARIAAARKPEETKMVIIAAGELFPGLQITENDIVGIQVPVKYVPIDAFSTPDLVVGAIPRERILPNEFILPGRLADAESGVGLNVLVPAGMRAVSLNLGDTASLSGFLQPGNRVDILVSIADNETGKLETLTALQTVPVLAVNSAMFKTQRQRLEEEKAAKAAEAEGKKPKQKRRMGSAPSVTLAVTPEQAEILVHASQIGAVTLALRSDGDVEQSLSLGVNSEDLLGEKEEPKPEEPKAAKPKPKKVEPPKETGVTLAIIRGNSVTNRTYTPPPQ